MKSLSPLRLALTLLAVFLLAAAPAFAADDPAPELKTLVARVQEKIQKGQRSPANLAEELAAFDALVAKYDGQKSESVADIHFFRALLYANVLQQSEKAEPLFAQIVKDFPGTRAAQEVERQQEQRAQQIEAEKKVQALAGKPAPEIAFQWSTREGLGKLSDLKGKVVMLDFWATWCGPCVATFPKVRELQAHYAGRDDVVILGVTSIQGRVVGLQAQPISTRGDPQREMALMKDYIQAKDITWIIAFSTENVFNPDYGVMGIPHVAIVAPDGTVRHPYVEAHGPVAHKIELIDALVKEFKLGGAKP